jgi:hypothetical protein
MRNIVGLGMFDFHEVSSEKADRLNAIADGVGVELHLAGIPVRRNGEEGAIPGAEIEVDTGDDAGGGVYVTWQPSSELLIAVGRLVQEGQNSAPLIEHFGAINHSMQTAVISILESASYEVEAADDDMRPFAVRVNSKKDSTIALRPGRPLDLGSDF